MVSSFCKAEDYQQIVNISNELTLVRFSKEPIMIEKMVDDVPTGELEDSGYVKFLEAHIVGELTPAKVAAIRQEQVEAYDKTSAVNVFYVNGKSMWFDKVTRTCIAYSMGKEKESGMTETTLYDNDNIPYVLPIDMAQQLFGSLEIYAKECYNVTRQHQAELASLGTVQEVLDYDITAGYPEKLSFNLTAE